MWDQAAKDHNEAQYPVFTPRPQIHITLQIVTTSSYLNPKTTQKETNQHHQKLWSLTVVVFWLMKCTVRIFDDDQKMLLLSRG